MSDDPGKDGDLRQRIENGARSRANRASPLHLRRTSGLRPEFEALAEALVGLRVQMGHFGEVRSNRAGLGGRLELLAKRLLRKLVRRHLDQQQAVQIALAQVLDRLTALLINQAKLLDENVERLQDEALRRDFREPGA